MNELIEGFCRWIEGQEKMPRTVRAYQDKAEKLIEYLGRHKVAPGDVTAEKIDQYMQFLLIQKKQSSRTRRQTFYALKRFFDYLVARGVAPQNPVASAARIRKERKVQGCLTNDEVTRLIYEPGLTTEIGMRDTAIMALLAGLGTRASALCNLRIGDMRAEEIVVPPRCPHCDQVDYAGASRLRGKRKTVAIIKVKEKGGKEWDIPIHDKAAFFLNQYLCHRKHGKDSEIIFVCYRRKEIRPLNRHGLYGVVRKYAARAGIPGKVTPHSFRRAAITWLLDSGMDPMVVKNFFGHSFLETTELYRHVTHRSFNWSGIAAERNLLEAIETPMDGLMDRLGRGKD